MLAAARLIVITAFQLTLSVVIITDSVKPNCLVWIGSLMEPPMRGIKSFNLEGTMEF